MQVLMNKPLHSWLRRKNQQHTVIGRQCAGAEHAATFNVQLSHHATRTGHQLAAMTGRLCSHSATYQ